MEDHRKTRDQLIVELTELRQRIRDLETALTESAGRRGAVASAPDEGKSGAGKPVPGGATTRGAGSAEAARGSGSGDLQEAQLRFRTLVEHMPDVVFIADRNEVIQYVNHTTPGTTVDELAGTTGFQHIPPEYHDLIRRSNERAFATGEVQYYEVPDRYGLAWSCRAVPLVERGSVDRLMVICTDITQRKEAEQAVEEERQHLRRLLDMHERDRKLVAYEIHDGVAQRLLAARMACESSHQALGKEFPGAPLGNCQQMLHLLDQGIAEARRLMSGQRPLILDEAGLLPAIQHFLNEAAGRTGAEIEYSHRVRFQRLPAPLETCLYRIVQEAVTNALRHSGSPKIRLRLVGEEAVARIEVEDWGRGFRPDDVSQEAFGLEGIRERAKLFGGNATIRSAPGEGTRVVVELPTES